MPSVKNNNQCATDDARRKDSATEDKVLSLRRRKSNGRVMLLYSSALWLIFATRAIAVPMEPTSFHTASLYDDYDLHVLDDLLRNYDRRVTPTHHLNAPTKVKCDVYIRSFGSVNPSTMDYEVDLYLRQTWVDARLHSENLTRPLDLNDPVLVRRVWRPDVYFPNAKHGEFQYVTVPNVLVRINPQGELLYMLRLKLTFSCMMDMERYPLDSQICTIELASFSKTTKEVELDWQSDKAVTMYRGVKMAQFSLQSIRLTQCKESFHIGEYSCLRAELDLKRSIGHHLVQSYLPSTLIVVISWVSFWLDVDAIPARITLGVTTLLTISSESSDQQANLAPVSYVKALDVWMGTCTMFVFAALLEFTFVNYVARKKFSRIKKTDDSSNAKHLVLVMTPDGSDAAPTIKDAELPISSLFCGRAKGKKIDQISRVAFPVAFIIFNGMYWPYYMH